MSDRLCKRCEEAIEPGDVDAVVDRYGDSFCCQYHLDLEEHDNAIIDRADARDHAYVFGDGYGDWQ